VESIAESSDGNIWFTWGVMIVQITGTTGHRTRLIIDSTAFKLLVDADGTSWIGTAGGGLRRFNDSNHPENSRADRFLPADGFSSRVIYSGLS